jgi:hypothetical protein
VVSSSSPCTKLTRSQTHTSDQSPADHSHHPGLDGAVAGKTGADPSPVVNSTTGAQFAPISSDAMLPSEPERASLTPSVCSVYVLLSMKLTSYQYHIPDQSATDHSDRRVQDASYGKINRNTSIIEETGGGKSFRLHWPNKTQMAVTMSSSGKMSSSVCDVWLICCLLKLASHLNSECSWPGWSTSHKHTQRCHCGKNRRWKKFLER